MPLYQNQTNLAGQGKFAPGVNYYAGIRAPVPSAPSLPKHEASFNIDLSRIGDAMIAAKESETKLGLAAVEMEQNLRNAERDRQLKIDLANMEQDRADARLDKELTNRMDIAKLNNAVELQKAYLKKSKQEKENNLAQAEQDILGNEELQQAFLDYSADPVKRELEYQVKRNQIIANTAAKWNVKASSLQTVVSNAGWSKGVGNNIETANEMNKKIVNDQYEQDKILAQTINPGGYSQNPEAAIQQATGLKQRIAQVKGWQELRELPGQSQHIKDWANTQINSNVGNIALDIALAAATKAQEELGTRALDNPEVYLETTKQITTAEIAAATGLGAGEIRPVLDGVYLTSGLTGTMQSIFTEAGNNAQYKQKVLQYTKDTGMLDILQNGPEFAKTALVVGNLPLFSSLDPDEKRMYSQIVSGALFGRVRSYNDEKTKETKWEYSYRGNAVSYTEKELNDLGKRLGLDVRKPDQIVAFVGSQILSNGGLSAGVKNGTILQKDAYPITTNTVRNITGNKDSETGLETFNLTPEGHSQLRKNIVNCAENNICTSDDILSNMDAFAKDSKEQKKVLEIGRGFEAETRLGKFFKNSLEESSFNDAVNYIRNVSNIKGEDVAKFFGKKYEDDPEKWNHWDLKNTKIYYKEEDGKLRLKFFQGGWFKTGGTELQKRLDIVSNTLDAAGVPVEGQKAFYNNSFGNVLSTNIKDESAWNEFATRAQEFVFDNTAKLDTSLLSWLTEGDIDNLQNITADEYAFAAGWTGDEAADRNMWNKLDELGKEDYGALKQGLYGTIALAVRGLSEVARSIYNVGETTVEQMTEAYLDLGEWLRNLKGINLNPDQISTVEKVAKQIIKENKKKKRILTADEAFDLFVSKPEPLNVRIVKESDKEFERQFEKLKAE